MDLTTFTAPTITPIYLALLGLMMIPITLRVGVLRVSSKIDIGDGGDARMLRLMRSQGNFVETVPLAAILLLVMELMGAGDYWLHGLGAALFGGRVLHYVGLSGDGPFVGRPIGMVATLSVYLLASGWILVAVLG
jgi:uncharacterized membrane protein YecN with MAPEG domain